MGACLGAQYGVEGVGGTGHLGVPARWIGKVGRGRALLEVAQALLEHRKADAAIPAAATAAPASSGTSAKL